MAAGRQAMKPGVDPTSNSFKPGRIALVCVSREGLRQSRFVEELIPGVHHYLPLRLLQSLPPEALKGRVLGLEGGFGPAVASLFTRYEALVFVSAVSVAVRGIAPCLAGKAVDPAVVVIDGAGRYVVSLLSGHLGGANEMTHCLARHLGAEAVITTATDGRGLPAFDDLARRWGWQLENLAAVKAISAALLEDREVYLYSSRPFPLTLPGPIIPTTDAFALQGAANGAVLVTPYRDLPALPPGAPALVLRPRSVAAGIGCRRGVDAEEILSALLEACSHAGISEESLSCLATITLKSFEEGLRRAAAQLGLSLQCYSPAEISAAPGCFEESDFVRSAVGVGAVAAPCAVLASGGGRLLEGVWRGRGVTVALAEGELSFSGSSPGVPGAVAGRKEDKS